ncbi:MAG: hypothetical protein DHS20C01_09750 [marine bacterium B5-7]|nr:MAG: hypothetical protein DHS20C01_09750 [marine bacterium B5-7]
MLVAWIVIMAFVAALFWFNEDTVDMDLASILRPVATPLKSFELTDQFGDPFVLDNLDGKWSFVFFGYTYCPDICPATLTILSSLARDLESRGLGKDNFQMVFVSVDPERDSVEQIRKYLAFFGDRYIGVTAEPDELLAFAKQFGAMFEKQGDSSSDAYYMAHTSSIFLVSPKTELVAAFSPPHDYKTISSLFLKYIEWR